MKFEFVAVDFDGTLCRNAFPEIGEPNQFVIDYVKRLAAAGSKIILYTSRENGTRKLLDEAVAFCAEQEIPLYAVNENPGNHYAASIGLQPSDNRKVYADLYIDDKALNPAQIETALMPSFPPVTEPNPPLRLEELREMDGEPVWVDALDDRMKSGYGLVCVNPFCGPENFCASMRNDAAYFATYGKFWLAYRMKPEEGTTWQQ